jgi:hypothetical protein
MSRITWKHIVAFVAIVAVTFFVGILLLPLVWGWYGGSWAMGPGMMGGQTQGGWWPFHGYTGRYPGSGIGGVFAWISTLALMLFPVGLLVLLLLGIVWVARAVLRPTNEMTSSSKSCPRCAKPVEVDWRACPFCGEDLERLR